MPGSSVLAGRFPKSDSSLPKSDIETAEAPAVIQPGLLTCSFTGVSDGIRTRDIEDHNDIDEYVNNHVLTGALTRASGS
jgi:hypothetical protein